MDLAGAGMPRALSGATTVVGVIGDPVAHSLSPLLHNTAFQEMGIDWVSVGFPVPSGQAGDAMVGAAALGIRGLSVTMPHKDAVAVLVEQRTAVADRIGAVNCLVRADSQWRGDNTDGAGFVASLRRGGFDPEGWRCLVVGGGGAARAVIAALAGAGAAEVVVVNRTPDRAVRAAALAGRAGRVGVADDARGCDLVVNATPLGMEGVPSRHGGAPSSGAPAGRPTAWPVDPPLLGRGQMVVDLVYHPAVTPWMAAARARGAVVANGVGMLVHQAALQLAAWTGHEVPVEAMWAVTGGPPERPDRRG